MSSSRLPLAGLNASWLVQCLRGLYPLRGFPEIVGFPPPLPALSGRVTARSLSVHYVGVGTLWGVSCQSLLRACSGSLDPCLWLCHSLTIRPPLLTSALLGHLTTINSGFWWRFHAHCHFLTIFERNTVNLPYKLMFCKSKAPERYLLPPPPHPLLSGAAWPCSLSVLHS